jgi:hypothetical protein
LGKGWTKGRKGRKGKRVCTNMVLREQVVEEASKAARIGDRD